ncbi:hypothetical protein Tco_0321126 [Tanacetum coccineum]
MLDQHRKELHEQLSQILFTIRESETPESEAPTFVITIRSGVSTQDPPFPASPRPTSDNLTEGEIEKERPEGEEPRIVQEPIPRPSIFYQPSKSSNLPFLSRLKKQKKDDENEQLLSIFKQIHINLPFLETIIRMPKGVMTFLEMDEESFVPIILGRPFLATARAVDTVNHDGEWTEEEEGGDHNEVLAVSFYPRTEPVEPLEWKALKNRLKPSSVESSNLTNARMSKFEADFKQQQSEMTNKINTVLKAITDRIAGALPSDTVKNPKLSPTPVLSALEKVYGMMAGLHADSADASDAAAKFAMMGISIRVVLRIPRKHDLYTFHISDLQPEQKVTCFVAKSILDESTRWHPRMAHILHQNRSRIIDAIEDYAEELAKLQRQEYEAKDAAARYGYLFSQATAEILCQAEAEIRDQGVSAVKDHAGVDSAVKDPAGVDSNVKICGVDSVMVYLWQSFVIKPSAVSSSVSADFHPVYADESTLSGQQLGSSETIHDFPSPQIPCVEVELPVLPNDCDTIHPLVSASLGDSCVLCYVKKRAQKSTFGESAFIGYIQDQQRIQSYDQSIVDLLDFLSQSEATVLNQQYGWKTVHSCGANHAIGSKMDFEEQAGIARGIVVRNIKARLVHRDTTQEDGIDSMSWTLRVPFSMEKLKKKCMSLSLKDLKILTSQSMYTEWFIMLCRISSSTSAGMQDCLLFVKTYYEEFVHVPDINDSDYAGSHGDRKSLQVDVNFWAGRLISGSAKRDIVATSSTEAEYVAAASCSAQVLWIQNQLLDYGWSSVGVYYGSAGSYLYVDDGFCLVVLDSAGSYLFLLDAGSGLCCTMGSACYLFMLDSLFLLVDMALMLGEAIPLSPPMLAIAAAGDAADEPNAAANEAAGSTAEGIPCTSSPPPWPSVPVPRPPTPPAQTLRFEEPFSVWLDGKIRLIGNCVGNVSKKNNGGCTFDPCIPRRDVDIQDEVDLGRIITLWH